MWCRLIIPSLVRLTQDCQDARPAWATQGTRGHPGVPTGNPPPAWGMGKTEATLGYAGNPRTAWGTQGNPVSHTHTYTKRQKSRLSMTETEYMTTESALEKHT